MSTTANHFIRSLPRILAGDPFTDEEFDTLCSSIDNIHLERTKEGAVLMHSPTGGLTGNANAEITRQLGNWWADHGQGRIFDSSAEFYLPDNSALSPDASYVGPEKLKGLTKDDLKGFPRLCPDFVIELLSRSDSMPAAKSKMELWHSNGVLLGWLINPYTRTVYVYPPTAQGIAFIGKLLAGTGPVEGFTLNLERVWRCYEV